MLHPDMKEICLLSTEAAASALQEDLPKTISLLTKALEVAKSVDPAQLGE